MRLMAWILAGLAMLAPGAVLAQQAGSPPMPPPPGAPPTPKGAPQNWVTHNDYPVLSVFAGEQGMVGFRLTIDQSGAVTDCVVTSTSGFPNLDATTCALMRWRAKFNPARDAAGRAVAGHWSSRFRWNLTDPTPLPRLSGTTMLQFTLDTTGRVTKCEERGYGFNIPYRLGRCAWLRATPPAELMKLRGTATGRVTMIVQTQRLINPQPMPPHPWLPEAGYKQVGVYRVTFDINEAGRAENCAGAMRPGVQCADLYPYAPGADRRSVMWRVKIITNGDPAVTEATDRFFR